MFSQLLEEPELGIAAHPIFDQLYQEMCADIEAAEQLLAEADVDFDYFDNTDWDEWTEISIPAPISHLVALLTETQLMMTITDPRETGEDN